MNHKVLCYGEMLWDLFPDVAVLGGAPMNVDIGLKKLGADVSMLSSCGYDMLGENLLEYPSANGLSARLVQQNNYPTGVVNVYLSENNDASDNIVFPSAWDYIQKPKVHPELDALVYGSLSCRNKTSFDTLITILNNKALKVFDVNFRPPYVDKTTVEQLLQKADIVKMNQDELFQISKWNGVDLNDLEVATEFVFQKYAVNVLCLILGSEGAYVRTTQEEFVQNGFEVKTIDTVGAGDAFLAGFIYNYLQNKPLQKTLEFACRLGVYVASQKGPILLFRKQN